MLADPLNQIQRDIQALLLGDPDLYAVPVDTFKAMAVQAAVNEAVNAWADRSGLHKNGCAIQIRLPVIRPKTPNVPGPQLEIVIPIRIFEDPVTNQSGLTAESVGVEVLQWLDGQEILGPPSSNPQLGDYVATLTPDPRGNALVPVFEYSDRLCYEASLVAQFPQDARARVTMPNIADDGRGNVTLSCPDPAATIYYTLDGSCPIIPLPVVPQYPVLPQPPPPNGTVVYAGPFPVVNGATVRWLAWKLGSLPSYVMQAVVTTP